MKRAAWLVAAAVTLLASAVGAEPYDIRMDRASGADRVATAVAVSAAHWSTSPNVLIATAGNFPDALAAGGLAASQSAPLLLTPATQLATAVRSEVQRLGATKAFILGGPGAVSGSVEAELQEMNVQTHRLAGENRFETAKLIAEFVGRPQTREAVVASGVNWPDAVSAGALSASPARLPILLTERDSLRPEAHQALQSLGIQRVFLAGGPAAVSEGVESQLRGIGFEVIRLFGANRYATSAAIATEAGRRLTTRPYPVVLATGGAFADALAASALAAQLNGTLVLVPSDDLNGAPDVAAFLQARRGEIERGVIVGGPSAVRGLADWQLRAAVDGAPVPTPSFGDGTRRVGADVAPGTYRNSGLPGQSCYWERLSGFGGTFDEIEANDIVSGRTIVTILPSDAGFSSSRCGTWSPDLTPITSSPLAPFPDGTYLVGSELAPGSWRNTGPSDGCYWERLSGFTGDFDQIIANGLSDAQQIVTIAEGDAGFVSNRCGTWERTS